MRVTVDVERCVGSGMCVLTAEEVFDQDQTSGTVIVLLPEPPVQMRDAVRRAVDLCPAAAIALSAGSDAD